MLIAFIAYVVVGLVAAVALSVAWLTLRALWAARVTRQRERFWHELGHALVTVVGDAAAETRWLEAARRHPPHILRYALNEYLIRTAGEYRDGIARLYRALGLLAGDLAELRSWRWPVRMRALRRLAGVVTAEQREEVARLADEGGEMRLLVAQIIGRIGSAADVMPLLRSWRIGSRLAEYPVHVMVNALPPEGMRELLLRWHELGDATIQRILLQAAAKVVPSACHTLLPEAARHPSLEVRLAAAHACGAITSHASFALLQPLAKDAVWEVRAQAVKALGSHSSRAALDLLSEALCDKSFWVRQNAAAALSRHGEIGVARLFGIFRLSPDRFARDAAEQVLTDLGLIETAVAS